MFRGFPYEALTFYDRLELENTREFWVSARDTYEAAVRQPIIELTDALADEFGAAHVFRPYRDVRFRVDKSPYKTHQGASVRLQRRFGYYVQISSAGVLTRCGFFAADAERLASYRSAVAGPAGDVLQRRLEAARGAGLSVGGETLKTAPRGYARDHERIGLLRHKSLYVERDHGSDPVMHTPELVDVVRADWRAARPVVEWLAGVL